ncbi:MAG: hypothetical protein MJZ15_04495 [Bacteroidales bacterium]|nr:hypothetical protein [Bacteroidales bacterium]
MWIKTFAFLSLLPSMYTINKVNRRQDLTFIDLTIVMHTVYHSLIPLLFNTDDILYIEVREDFQLQFWFFIVLNSFLYILIAFDLFFRNKIPLLNLSQVIRLISERYVVQTSTIVIIIALVIIQFYVQQYAFEHDGDLARYQGRKISRNELLIFITGFKHTIRLLIALLITISTVSISNKRVRLVLYTLAIIEFLLLLLQARTYMLDSMTFVAIILYSILKDRIRLIDLFKVALILLLTISTIFPLITGVRKVRKSSIREGETGVVSILSNGLKAVGNNEVDMEQTDNVSTRVWNVYQISVLAFEKKYYGNGEVISEAISFGIPKIIYPSKSKYGSQGLITRKLGTYNDIADSVLLAAIVENRLMAPLLASIYYIFIITIYDYFIRLNQRLINNKYITHIILVSVFPLFDRIEYSIDGTISDFIQAEMRCFVLLLFIMFIIGLTKKVCREKNFMYIG